jgi:cytochrome c553
MARAKLGPAVKGSILLAELNCVACHERKLRGDPKQAPRLATVAGRLHPDHIERFLRNPHEVKPGTTRPPLPVPRPAGDATREKQIPFRQEFLSGGLMLFEFFNPETDPKLFLRVGLP